MRALITFIAILTVGIVTAQDNPDTYRGHISYNHVDETISVPNVGEGSTTYNIVGDLHRNLNDTYDRGSDHIYHYKREIDLIRNHLVSFELSPSHSPTINGREPYRLLIRVNDGSGEDMISLPDGLFNEQFIDLHGTTQDRIDATLTTNRGSFNDRYAYSVSTILTISNDNFDRRAAANINLRFTLPERYHGLASDIIFFEGGRVIINRDGGGDGTLPNIPAELITDFPAVLTASDRPTYYSTNPAGRSPYGYNEGDGGFVERLDNGRHFPLILDYRFNHRP